MSINLRYLSVCFLLIVNCISAQNGMQIYQNDFISFDENLIKDINSELLLLTPDKYREHPEFGTLPYNSPCKDCYELLEKRQENSRYFIKKGTSGKQFYLQQSYSPLHFKKNDVWITIDQHISKHPSINDLYWAPDQISPTLINIGNQTVTITNDYATIAFNRNLSLLNKNNETTKLLALADWNNYTVGKDGAYINNVFPGIDMEIIALTGKFKTNFIIRQSLGQEKGWLIIRDDMYLSENMSASAVQLIESEGSSFVREIKFSDKTSNITCFELDEALCYDNSGNKEQEIIAGYTINNNIIDINIPMRWLSDESRIYPVTIDPVLASSSLSQGSITGSMYNASCTFTNACTYNLPVTVPVNSIVTDAQWSFTYRTYGSCLLKDGAIDFMYNGCRSPGAAGFYWFCNSTGTGTCTGTNVPFFSDISSCIPTPNCSSFVMNFAMNFYRTCLGTAGCNNNTCIGSDTPWTITIIGESALSTAPTGITVSTSPICPGNTSILTVNGGSLGLGASWKWYSGSCGGTSIGTGASVTVSPATTTNYYVRAEGTCNTTSCASNAVTVSPAPPADAGVNQSVCSGSSLALTATGGVSYSWDNGVTQAVPFTPAATTTYTVTVTGANGCTATDNVTIIVNPLPTANAGINQSVCTGMPATLNATGGISYAWDNGVTQGIPFTPSTTTTYNVTVTDANGCIATDNVIITVNPIPTAEAGTDQGVCSGDSVTLAATGGTSYTWDNGVTQATPFTPVATTTYAVTVTDANGCTATDNVIITVNPIPTAEAGTDKEVCSGTSVTLTATGGTSYTWDNGVTQATPFTPVATTTYAVTVTDANGCLATDNVIIVVNTIPNAEAGENQTVCSGSSVTLTATGGTNYVWDNGVTQGFPFIPVSTSTYNVTVIDMNGCIAYDSLIITVNPNIVFDLGPDFSACADSIITLDAGTGASYQWSTGETTQIVNITGTGAYSVTVTDGSGCSGTDSLNIIIYPLPVAEAGTNQAICSGDSVTLTAAGGNIYMWDNGVIQGTPFIPATTATYNVTITDVNGCMATDNIVVTLNILPIAEAGADQEVCSGIPVTLIATGGTSYTWDNGINQNIPFVPINTSTYNVTVTDTNGCSATDNIIITINPLPTAEAGSDQTICSGSSVTLTATGGINYLWDNGVTQGVSFYPTVTAHYNVTVTDTNGCTNTDSLEITVGTSLTVDLGPDITACEDSIITLNAGMGSSYQWSTGEITQTITVSSEGAYSVTVTDSFGCSGTDNITISQTLKPAVDIGSNQETCEGTSILLDAGQSAGASYQWTGGGQAQTLSVFSSGTYYVTVSNSCGSITDSVVITVNMLPIVDLGSDLTTFKDSIITLDAGISGMTYQWSTGLTSQTIQITPSASTTVWVLVTDANTCKTTDTITIHVIEKPTEDIIIYNTFTPNSDGKNDKLYIDNIEKYPKSILTIYNRNGVKIYEKENYKNEEGWDGMYHGIYLPASTYYYILNLNEKGKNDYKGYITIMR